MSVQEELNAVLKLLADLLEQEPQHKADTQYVQGWYQGVIDSMEVVRLKVNALSVTE